MSLSRNRTNAQIAVSDRSEAERFYEGKPVRTDEKGIHDSAYGKVAWFKDPDGNTFALEQV
jgi:hypothetical protein